MFCSHLHTADAQQQAVPVYLGIENGLSNNSVTCVYQDRFGLIWVGTYDGLNRYDGYESKVYRHRFNDSSSLCNNRVTVIAEDEENRLWIGTKKGVSTYSGFTQRFSPVYYEPHSGSGKKPLDVPVNEVVADGQGNIFMAAGSIGLLMYRKKTGSVEQVPFLNEKGNSVHDFQVQSILREKDGTIRVFIHNQGIGWYDPEKKVVQVQNSSMRMCTTMETDGNGLIWMARISDIYQYDLKTNTYKYWGKVSAGGESILCLSHQKNQLLIGTDGAGIVTPDLEKGKGFIPWSKEEEAPLLKSNCISALYQDAKNNQWIGTLRGGLNFLPAGKKPFASIAHHPGKPGLPGSFVSAFGEDRDGRLWVGTDGNGLSVWDRKSNEFTNFNTENSSLSNNLITSICRTYDDQIWVGTYGNGVDLFDKKTGKFINYPCINHTAGLIESNVWTLYEDKDSVLWAGTVTGRLFRLNRTANRFEVFDQQLTDILCLAEDKQGNLWGGNFESLIRIDRKSKKHEFFPTEAPVRVVREDRNGQLWAGTEGNGLLLFNKKTQSFQAFTEENGLANNAVLNMLEDKNGHLWLSTFHGLSRMHLKTRHFRNFFQSDGLQSNQFIYNAAFISATGQFFFGGLKGLNYFEPDSVALSYGPLRLLITDIRIDNKPIAQDNSFTKDQVLYTLETLRLPYDKAVLSVDFAAPEFNNPDQILYAYYLEGWDKDWHYSGKIRTAHYSHLREGSYKLRIKSTNAGGVWGNKERVIRITVLPPFYRSWWAWLLYIGVATGLLALYLRFRNKQAKLAYEIKLAHLNAERESEIHEKKIDFFTNIAHEFRTPLSLIINPIKDFLYKQNSGSGAEGMKMAYRNSKRLLSLVNQLLLFKKADHGADELRVTELNLIHVCKEVFLCFTQQAKTQQIQYSFECASEKIMVFADREKIEIALFNLISNAMKFTPAKGSIHLVLSEKKEEVAICVADSGCGIPEEEKEKLFERFYQSSKKEASLKSGFGIGLFLAKSFVEAHKGNIDFESRENEGTRFFIRLKKGNAHFAPGKLTQTPDRKSEILEELNIHEPEELADAALEGNSVIRDDTMDNLITAGHTMLLVDDNEGIKEYLKQVFQESFRVLEASNGKEGLALARQYSPDIIISDIVMNEMSGIEFCHAVKEDPALSHIQMILLTGSTSEEIRLRAVECGADDYITKPFSKDLLLARVSSLLKSRNNLQKYFYNAITLRKNNLSISEEYKNFLEKCIETVEANIDRDDFSIKLFAKEMGMSHSNLYKRVKQVSGQSIASFLRFIKLRKAAELLISTDCNVNEAAFQVGISDGKYFRIQFARLFGMNPSEYKKRFHPAFRKTYQVHEKAVGGSGDPADRSSS